MLRAQLSVCNAPLPPNPSLQGIHLLLFHAQPLSRTVHGPMQRVVVVGGWWGGESFLGGCRVMHPAPLRTRSGHSCRYTSLNPESCPQLPQILGNQIHAGQLPWHSLSREHQSTPPPLPHRHPPQSVLTSRAHKHIMRAGRAAAWINISVTVN